MLPFTLIGFLVLIGLLGTMPFLTAIVYLRNVLSAACMARAHSPAWITRVMFVFGVLMAIGMPWALHQAMGRQIGVYLHPLPDYMTRWL